MGLDCCPAPPIPEEVKKILKTIEEKSPEILDMEVNKKKKIKDKLNNIYGERAQKVSEAKDKSEDELKKLLIEYNKKELKKEKKLISVELDKMHSLWELGIELADPLKNFTIDELKKKLDKVPELANAAVNSQIAEIKAYSPKEFLNSKFGKPLKEALIKQGMSKTVLEDYKKELLEDRKKRRKEEKEKFPYVKQNEFPPEDEFEFKIVDLYESIFDEYKGAFKEHLKKNLLFIEDDSDDDDDD